MPKRVRLQSCQTMNESIHQPTVLLLAEIDADCEAIEQALYEAGLIYIVAHG